MKIGIFDSGIGGLTVLKEAIKRLPNEDFIYFADTENVPYGTKSKVEVSKFMFDAATFLAKQSIKALVIACNTATSIAINDLRLHYKFPIIGMEPAVKPAIEYFGHKRILVTATSLTLKEEKLENLLTKIDTNHVVDKLSLDGLVGFAEKFIFSGIEIEQYLKEKFNLIDFNQYGAVVLGCTHFIYYKEIIRKMIDKPSVELIDGNLGTINRLKTLLIENNLETTSNSKGSINFIKSSKPEDSEIKLLKMKSFLDLK